MNALANAHVTRENHSSPRVGFASGGLPEASRSHTGVSSRYVPTAGHGKHARRVACHSTDKGHAPIAGAGMQWCKSMCHISEKEIGKKKLTMKHLLPNLSFLYAEMITFKGKQVFKINFIYHKQVSFFFASLSSVHTVALFVCCIGRVARYTPSSTCKNISPSERNLMIN